jgi:hypothetical protein
MPGGPFRPDREAVRAIPLIRLSKWSLALESTTVPSSMVTRSTGKFFAEPEGSLPDRADAFPVGFDRRRTSGTRRTGRAMAISLICG